MNTSVIILNEILKRNPEISYFVMDTHFCYTEMSQSHRDRVYRIWGLEPKIGQSIFEVFESEFGRLLSQPELVMLNNWMKQYTEADILDALRNAMVYKKVSMNYINTILANKQKEKQG